MTSVKVLVIGLKVLRMTLIGPGDGVSIMISVRYIFIIWKETRTCHSEIKYGDSVSVARVFNRSVLGFLQLLPWTS